MDNAELNLIFISLQNQDLRIRVGLDTSLGSLIALMTFLALFTTLGSVTTEIILFSLVSGLMLFVNLLYCFFSLGINKIPMGKDFEDDCEKIANNKDGVIRYSRFLYLLGATFMFIAFALSMYSNWR